MKTKFVLLLMLSALLFSFSPVSETNTPQPATSLDTMVLDDAIISFNEEVTCDYTINIVWANDAAFGVDGYAVVRANILAYAMANGLAVRTVTGANTETWTFRWACNIFNQKKADLEEVISTDDDIEDATSSNSNSGG